jgi:helix-turn-helix protein
MYLYDNATKAQALTLKLAGVSNAKITSITGIKTRNLNLLYQKRFHVVLISPRMQNS